jgi:hypothetical protein
LYIIIIAYRQDEEKTLVIEPSVLLRRVGGYLEDGFLDFIAGDGSVSVRFFYRFINRFAKTGNINIQALRKVIFDFMADNIGHWLPLKNLFQYFQSAKATESNSK